MTSRGGLTRRDEPKSDLSRRVVAKGKIGVAGPVPKMARILASEIGLPHRDAWTSEVQPRRDGRSFAVGRTSVWPLRSRADVDALVAGLKRRGLPDEKAAILAEYLPKQIGWANGLVVAAAPSGMRHATTVMSLFREVEVDDDNAVGYHVHLESMVDLSAGGSAGKAVREVFRLQAAADLATLAHSLKKAGRERPVALHVESNNEDTHRWVDAFADIVDGARERIDGHPAFVRATSGIEFEPAQGHAWEP